MPIRQPLRLSRSSLLRQLSLSTTFLLIIGALVLLPQRAQAFTFTVTNTNDSGTGSLRDAVVNANSGIGADVINITAIGTINLQTALPDITDSVTISGPGAAQLTIRRPSNLGGDPSFRVLTFVGPTKIFALSGVTLSGGRTSSGGNGGGIWNNGTLTINNCVITGNGTTGFSRGGGIYSADYRGSLTINNSTISNNSASEGYGGGIYAGHPLTITNSSVTDNSDAYGGGGLYIGDNASISNTTISNNTSNEEGGGIYSNSGNPSLVNVTLTNNTSRRGGGGLHGVFNITGGVISGNRATDVNYGSGGGLWGRGTATGVVITGNQAATVGGALYSNGNVTLTESTISGNIAGDAGGAIFSACCGTINVVRSILANNQAGTSGGGIYSEYVLNVTNSTLTGNRALTSGGGIYHYGYYSDTNATITNVTIYGNLADSNNDGIGTGGGVFRSTGTVKLRNTIVGGNTRRTTGVVNDDCNGALVLEGKNLLGQSNNGNGCPTAGANVILLTVPINSALVTTLANNGGASWTHALPFGSPAINAGDNSFLSGIGTDQRGVGFPRIAGTTVDIGAFEYSSTVAEPPANVNLLYDGGFDYGFGYWAPFGGLAAQVTGGWLEFWRWAGVTSDAGFYQFNPNSAPAGTTFEFTFTIANTSNRYKTVALLIRHPNWSNLRICYLGLVGNYAARPLTMRARATNDWPQIVVQAYLLQADSAAAIRLDNLDLRYVPGLSVPNDLVCPTVGTEVEPGVLLPQGVIGDGGIAPLPEGVIPDGGVVPSTMSEPPVEETKP